MRKLLALCLFLAPALSAQTINPNTPLAYAGLNVQDTSTCSASSPSGSYLIQQLPLNSTTSVVSLSGTFSGTVTVYLSANNRSTWVAQSTTISNTTPVSYTTSGFTHICADVTTYTSGLIGVTINSNGGPGQGGGGGGGGGAPSPAYVLPMTNSSVSGFAPSLLSQDAGATTITNSGKEVVAGNSTVGSLTSNGNSQFKGPNPWDSIDLYGARATTLNTTGTGTATSTSLTVASSSFVNGDGITVLGGGAAPSMTTPSAPTVISAESASETGFETPMVAGGGGSSSYNYTVFAVDGSRGVTAASPVTTLTTGATTLGETQYTISSASLTGNTLTIVTTATNALVAGAIVHIVPTSNSYYISGWYPVASITNGTTFVITNVVVGAGSSTITASGGTVTTFLANQVTWPAVTGAAFYGVCSDRASPGTYHIIGFSLPVNTYLISNQFNDWGSVLSSNPPTPWYLSDANCMAVAAQNQFLTTTVASGGGTTSLTLTAPLGSSVTGTAVRLDAAPGILAAANAAVSSSSVYVPTGTFAINSPLTLPQNIKILQSGTLTANDTISLDSGVSWQGFGRGSANIPQFASEGYPVVTCNASPCVYGFASPPTIRNLQFTHVDNALNLVIVPASSTTYGPIVENVNISGGDNNDNMGIALITANNIKAYYKNMLFLLGPNQVTDQTWAPMIYFPPGAHSGGPFHSGSNTFDGASLNRRGILDLNAGGSGLGITIAGDLFYRQGGITPLVVEQEEAGQGNIGGRIIMQNISGDTEAQAKLVLWGTVGATVNFANVNGLSVDSGGTPAEISGSDSLGVPFIAPLGTGGSGPVAQWTYGNGTLSPSVSLSAPFTSLYYPLSTAVANTPTLSSGGSVSTGNLTLCIQTFDLSGNGGPCGNQVSVTVTTGNQTVTVTWAAVAGASGYEVWNTGGGHSSEVFALSYTFSSNLGCCNTLPTSGSAGLVLSSSTGIVTPAITVESPVLASGLTGSAQMTVDANGVVNFGTHGLPSASFGVGSFTTDISPTTSGGTPSATLIGHCTTFPTCTLSSYNLTAGHTLVVAATLNGYTISGISDTAGNSFSAAIAGSGNGVHSPIWISPCVTGNSSDVITVTISGSPAGSVAAWDVTGVMCSNQVDLATQFVWSNGATSPQTLNFTTSNANEIVLVTADADFGGSTPGTITGGWTVDYNPSSNTQQYGHQLFTSAWPGSVSMTFASTSGGVFNILALRSAPQLGLVSHPWQTVNLGLGTGKVATLDPVLLSANRDFKYPDASGTVSLDVIEACGTIATCANTVLTNPITVVGGPIALSGGTITITSLPFTSSTSYVCSPDDTTAINGIDVVYNSGSSVTFNGTTTDTIRYSCVGN